MSKFLTQILNVVRPVLKAVVAAALVAASTALVVGTFDWRSVASAAIVAAGVYVVPNVAPGSAPAPVAPVVPPVK